MYFGNSVEGSRRGASTSSCVIMREVLQQTGPASRFPGEDRWGSQPGRCRTRVRETRAPQSRGAKQVSPPYRKQVDLRDEFRGFLRISISGIPCEAQRGNNRTGSPPPRNLCWFSESGCQVSSPGSARSLLANSGRDPGRLEFQWPFSHQWRTGVPWCGYRSGRRQRRASPPRIPLPAHSWRAVRRRLPGREQRSCHLRG